MLMYHLHLQQQHSIIVNGYGFSPHLFPTPLLQRKRRALNRNQYHHQSFKAQAIPSRTQRIMESISVSSEVGGAGGASSYNALKRLDQVLTNICSATTVLQEPPQVVSCFPGSLSPTDLGDKPIDKFDVLVCGGTLGIFVATALSSKGLRVGIVEKNLLKGREQEWNISKKELLELVEVGILKEGDVEQAISVMFNPNRCGFEGRGEIWVEDILNLGISPDKLIEIMKKRFTSLGGVILEGYGVASICVYEDAAVLHLAEGNALSSRLIIDAMGNFSPVVKQIRSGQKPDGVCLVVGTRCRGFKENITNDVIFSSSSVKKVGNSEAHYFWEAFPAGSGPTDRTTYMFTYLDPQTGCPKLEELLEDYWDLMPKYQGVSLDDLDIIRVLFGIFPTYRDSPLPANFNRILQPNLSASWLFQRAMSAKKNANVSPDFINDLLCTNFQCMQRLGDPVVRPFLQDVIQFVPLVKTLGLVMLTKPQIIPSIFKQVGIPVLLDWSGHFFMLGYYTFLSTFMDPVIRPLVNAFPAKTKYEWRRHLEAWKYGAGLDYKQ
ncbi:hypothetical protein AQUCO_03200042v1 [Aquilegia coerulea]|uniref:Uncharacterized protein n=1 Tax=Aquilegia coerulea TaxID=218851 RepID=A0A2G5CZV2_AQUCA|nr:hypothetical protein AQUCO_03200042v1 [Aquilegia coerulea]